MDQPVAITEIAKELAIPEEERGQFNRDLLAATLNNWINEEFNRLVQVLYQMDIPEQKLRNLLSDHPGVDAAYMIADLMIERQLEKIKSRRQFSGRDRNISEDESW